jgi:hemerythrin-like domain-containing protein
MPAAQRDQLEEEPFDLGLEPAPHAPEAFRAPIDLIAADHERQLVVCGVMERLVHNPRHGAQRRVIEAVRTYLARDLPLHVADEEEDLFPLLRRRCPSGDRIDEIFDILCGEHDADARLNNDVSEDLEALIGGRALGDPARFLINLFAFSQTQRRHLAWENAVILPRARAYLTATDTLELGRRMARRRGMVIHD